MDLAVMYHYVMKQADFKGSVPINFRKQIRYGKENFEVNIPSAFNKKKPFFNIR